MVKAVVGGHSSWGWNVSGDGQDGGGLGRCSDDHVDFWAGWETVGLEMIDQVVDDCWILDFSLTGCM